MNDMVKSEQVLSGLQAAIEKGVGPKALSKLLDMQERILNRNAESAYIQAMVSVQKDMKSIHKNKTNDQTRSEYADLDQILKHITPVYTKAGFCLSFGNKPSALEGHVCVICDVMHIEGFAKQYYIDVPLDFAGIKGNRNKTDVHATGSANSYGQRYLLKKIFNLSTGDDDDGNSAGGDTRTAMDVEQEWIDRMTVLKTILPSVLSIKESLAIDDYKTAYEAYSELSQDEVNAVWYPAPTKGGILTTSERAAFRSPEMAEVRMSVEGMDPVE